ncbi:MAG: hypothetical protein AAGA75_15230 [Cyanobacteria bacterium P01_E01_bin.6]
MGAAADVVMLAVDVVMLVVVILVSRNDSLQGWGRSLTKFGISETIKTTF